jgi:hypothetical protein
VELLCLSWIHLSSRNYTYSSTRNNLKKTTHRITPHRWTTTPSQSLTKLLKRNSLWWIELHPSGSKELQSISTTPSYHLDLEEDISNGRCLACLPGCKRKKPFESASVFVFLSKLHLPFCSVEDSLTCFLIKTAILHLPSLSIEQ